MKVIFIDRDGVINKDPGGWTEYSYVIKWEDFHFLPGSKSALKRLTFAGYEIIIISNQQGVNKGCFTPDDLNKINQNMLKSIADAGGRIRSVHYCPHRKEEACGCRKPDTGLFEKAVKDFDVDFKETFFIGDGMTDIVAGKKLGCKTILVLSGKSKKTDIETWGAKPDYIKKDLSEAVGWILEEWRRDG
ncbi:MAG: HAD family hydrolase [Candidatus Omnitrophota bacterium]